LKKQALGQWDCEWKRPKFELLKFFSHKYLVLYVKEPPRHDKSKKCKKRENATIKSMWSFIQT